VSNIFSTTSLLLASIIEYSQRNKYLGYHDGKFCFDDSESTVQFLIGGFHNVNFSVNLKRYEKARGYLVHNRRKALENGGAK
jgi:hypothetical protein